MSIRCKLFGYYGFVVGVCMAGLLGSGMACAQTLSVSKSPFGSVNGTQIEIYKLTNRNGMEVHIITFGARVQAIKVPDKNDDLADVALGFDDVDGYMNLNKYMGATIGRYANRIAKGQFELDGKTYSLPVNNGPNSLHGGNKGFDQHIWQAKEIQPGDAVGVELSYLSPDGQMGYPGNLVTTVRYTLDNDNDLRIHYSAVSDKDTIINLTNHTYFNLQGAGSGAVLNEIAMINADQYSPIDKTEIPLGKAHSVQGTPFDFTTPTAIGQRIKTGTKQLMNAEPKQGGYDHNWILNSDGDLGLLAARVTDPRSGRTVELYTTEPGLQFYTGNFLHGKYKGKNGQKYQHWGAFTLETQHYPDSPNHPSYPSTELKAGQKYSQTTIFKFLPE